MTTEPEWHLVRVMPNLSLPAADSDVWTETGNCCGVGALSLNSPWIAIVPPHDDRLGPFLAKYAVASSLLDSFRTETGAPTRPSSLIVRGDAPIPRRIDAIAAFRNAAAMCFVLRARAASLADKGHQAVGSWSDLFDFHAAEIDTNGDIQIHSAALINWLGKPKKIHFAPSPLLSHDLDIRFCDETLTHLLVQAWRRLYVQGREVRKLRPIFRSLEIAYQAAAIPIKNVGSLNDFGLTIAQWISALEALLWPLHGYASRDHTIAFLSGVTWDHRQAMHRRYRVSIGKKQHSVNAAQKAVDLMYEARNAFLHGEKFTTTHLLPFSKRRRATLPRIAPVIFRAALVWRLSQLFPDRRDPLDREVLSAWFSDMIFEEALLEFFGRSA